MPTKKAKKAVKRLSRAKKIKAQKPLELFGGAGTIITSNQRGGG
jgi:hypothetical protein